MLKPTTAQDFTPPNLNPPQRGEEERRKTRLTIFGSHEKLGQVLKGLSMHICKLNDFVIMARYFLFW